MKPILFNTEMVRAILNNAKTVTRRVVKPRPIKGDNGIITHYESYPWEDIHETRIYKGKPWYVIGNPWVWCVEFERISREEALK